MEAKYVIAMKRIWTYTGGDPVEQWEFAQYDNHAGHFSTGYPVFGSECYATHFDAIEEAENWWKENSKYINFTNYDVSTLSIYKLSYEKVECLMEAKMSRGRLLKSLQWKYSFEKANSIVQIATEDREFENKDVKITMTRTLECDFYILEWK